MSTKRVSGAICNVPVNCDQTCKILPRPPERSGIIMLKLKRKLQFRGHIYFQAVRPQLIKNALNWLKQNNPLYYNVTTEMNHLDENLQNIDQTEAHCNTLSEDENMEESDDPLNEYRPSNK